MIRTVFALAVMACAPFAARAQVNVYTIDCSKLKLRASEGVPTMAKHSYDFEGECRVQRHVSGASFPVQAVFARATASWDAQTKEFTEVFWPVSALMVVLDNGKPKPVSGKVTSRFQCSADPLLGPSPCQGTFHYNATGWPELSRWHKMNLPMLRGLTTFDEAVALSPNVAPPQTGAPPVPVAVAIAPPPPGPLPAVLNSGLSLADGSELRFRVVGRERRWVVEDARGKVVRVLPAEATLTLDRSGSVRVTVGRAITELGVVRSGSP